MINMKFVYIYMLALIWTLPAINAQNVVVVGQDSTGGKMLPLLYEERSYKENIYSASHVFADKLSKTTSFSLFDAIKGRLSGYHSIIRGNGSVNQGPVMILVDGFEQGAEFVKNIDIEEVESVAVLKDAASTALYGQRAANGILMITTKRGLPGKSVIKVEGTYGMAGITEKPSFYNSYDYTGFYNEARQNDGLPAMYSEAQRQNYKSGGSDFYPNTDWYSEALKDFAPVAKASVVIRGGTPTIKYFVSTNYMNKSGLFENTDSNADYSTQEKHDRFNLRSNFDIQVFKNTSVRADIGGYIYDMNTPGYTSTQIFDALYVMPPTIKGIYENGRYGGNATYRNNPLALIGESGYSKYHYRGLNGAFKLTQDLSDIVEGLRFNGHVNFFNWALYRDNWRKDFSTEFRTPDETTKFGFDGTLAYTTSINQLRNAGTELYFDYTKNWGESSLKALLGFRLARETASGQNQILASMGSYGKVSYANKNRYFADLVMAYNGSQRFAPENRFGFFPALALGWLVSEEDFLKDHNSIELFKLRGSVGLTGSDYVTSAYRFMYFQAYLWSGGYYLRNDNAYQSAIIEGMPAYENAKWENSLKANFGFDLNLRSNLDIGFDLFLDNRYDILVPRDGSVPDMVGIGLPLNNQGKVVSKGLETTVDYSVSAGDFVFNLGGYFNFNKSKIIEMNEIPRPFEYLERTGLPVGQYFGLESLGFFKDQADINNSPKQLFSAVRPGDIKYKDQNNDGVIDEFDVVAIGKSNVPEIIYSFSPSISYKGFAVEALFYGVANYSVYLNTSQFWGFYNQRNLASNAVDGRWTASNPADAKLPRLTTMDNRNNYRLNDIWLVDGSFLKLQQVEARYNLPKAFVNKLKLSDIQIYLRANNVLSFDNIKNADPENLGPEPTYSLKNIGFKLTF